MSPVRKNTVLLVPDTSIHKLDVGDFDPMSRAARSLVLPLCGRTHGDHRCTRVAGHAESTGRRSHACQHVAVDDSFIAVEVW